MPLVLGVDSSTRATSVEVRDASSGALVATGRSPHPVTGPPVSEQDPSIWWSALIDAVSQTGQRDIAAISVAGQQHGLVVTDDAGSVLRRAKLWDDLESTSQAARLVEQFGAERWVGSVGLVPDASTAISKLAWLLVNERKLFDRIGHLMVPHDWLTFRLTGRVVTDRGDASGTGYWSPTANRWRPDILRRLEPTVPESEWLSRLPTVLGPAARADWLAAPVHKIVGLRGRPIVAVGTGRIMATALGVGLRPGQVVVCAATDGAVAVQSEVPVRDPSGVVTGFADATGRFLPTVRMPGALDAIETVARLMGVDGPQFDALATHASSAGVSLSPARSSDGTHGERTASIRGLQNSTTRHQLARAVYEGVVCQLLDGIDALGDAGAGQGDLPVHLVGPGARSPAYRQVLADLSGRPVVTTKGDEHVARGACVQAAAALAEVPPEEVIEAWGLGSGTTTEPGDVDADAVRAASGPGRARTGPGTERTPPTPDPPPPEPSGRR